MSVATRKTTFGILIILLVIGTGVAGFYVFRNKVNGPNPATAQPIVKSINYSVVLKETPHDKTKTDIYLKNPNTAQEIFYLTLSDVYKSHYHSAEYHNGNLYIIRRPGGEDAYRTNPNWTDELWKYTDQQQGQKIHSARGLDFRAANDETMITVTTNEEFNILDNNGGKIKTFPAEEVTINPKEGPLFEFLDWGPNSIWLDNTFGPSLSGLVKIDTRTYSITKYDLSALPAGPEYALNVSKELVAFSDYPAIFDVESAQELEQSKPEIKLRVYDLKTKVQQQIVTSIAKKFAPKWIDENTLEYNSPNGPGRLTKQIR